MKIILGLFVSLASVAVYAEPVTKVSCVSEHASFSLKYWEGSDRWELQGIEVGFLGHTRPIEHNGVITVMIPGEPAYAYAFAGGVKVIARGLFRDKAPSFEVEIMFPVEYQFTPFEGGTCQVE